jgi:radical SAM protein with 4Fe4S-binding SPASM domain
LLCKEENAEFLYKDALDTFLSKSMGMCDAVKRYTLTFDHEGNVYCCGQKVGDRSELYANIRDYDPDDGDRTSIHPEINHYYQSLDSLFVKCGDCVFLPKCRGECPAKRRIGTVKCPEYKDHPDTYVLHIVSALKEIKEERQKASENND